jgi:hypothetical protein
MKIHKSFINIPDFLLWWGNQKHKEVELINENKYNIKTEVKRDEWHEIYAREYNKYELYIDRKGNIRHLLDMIWIYEEIYDGVDVILHVITDYENEILGEQ